MKKDLFVNGALLLTTTALSLSSCTRVDFPKGHIDESETEQSKIERTFRWDESYRPGLGVLRSVDVNNSDEISVGKAVQAAYVGAVFTKKTVEDLTYMPIIEPIKPIDLTFTFPGYYFTRVEKPSKQSFTKALSEAIKSPDFTGEQLLSFEYDLRQFSHYKELKLAFGANVDIASLFKIEASAYKKGVSKTSALMARLVQRNFSAIMDYPEGGKLFSNEESFSKWSHETPVYVNSVIFGRIAIIAIESNYSYDELKAAFKASLSAEKVNGELMLSKEHKEILEQSEIKIYSVSGRASDIAKVTFGFHKFQDFIVNGAEFTRKVPGSAIFITANYVHDNSVFRTSYTLED